MYRITTLLLFGCLACFSFAQDASKSEPPPQDFVQRFNDGEELILTIRIDNFTFGEVFALKKANSVHVDFEGILSALDFPIYYNQGSALFQGWFINEKNTFSLSYSADASKPIIFDPEGDKLALSASDFSILGGLLYVSLERLNEWFGLDGEADFRDQMLLLNPKEQLPFQLRLDRKKMRIRAGSNKQAQYTRLSRGFGLLSPQAIDFQINGLYSERLEKVNGSYSLLGSRDIALFNTQFFLNGTNQNWLSNARLQLDKFDENNKLFGINNLASIKLGDVTPVRQASGNTLSQARGLRIDNLSKSNDINLDATSVTGEIQSDWDVELYRNGTLVGQQFEVQTGRFEFNDIPLEAGVNQLKIVMYGPQGQVIERVEERILDRAAISSDKIKYQASFTQNNRSLFGVSERDNLVNQDLGYNFSANMQTNIFAGTALNAGIISQFGGKQNTNIANISTTSAIANKLIFGVNLQVDDKQNYQAGISGRGSFLSQNLSLAINYLSNSALENASIASQNTSQKVDRIVSRLDMSGQMALGNSVRLSYRNDINHTAFEQNRSYELRNSIGLTTPFLDVFNNIIYQKSLLGEIEKFGSLSLQSSIGSVITRLNAGYTLDKEIDFNNLRLDLSWSPFDNISSRFTLNHNVPAKTNDYQLQTTWKRDNFNLIGVFRQSDILGFSAGLSTRISLGGAPIEYSSVFKTIDPVATKSSLLVRVFIDLNINAVYDEGEPVLENVKVLSVQSRVNALTNSEGIAVLTNLPSGRISDITLDYETLDNPFLVPLIEGVSIKSRAGYIDNLDFPLAIGNEVEGAVERINQVGETEAIARASVELIDRHGEVKHTAQTEFDGYYLFEGVIAGNYTLRISPTFLDRAKLKSPSPKQIRIFNDTGLVSGLNFYVENKEFADAYVPLITSFSNDQMASFFWSESKHRSELSVFEKSAFIMREGNKSRIGLALFESRDIAEQVCNILKQSFSDCTITRHTVEVNHVPSSLVSAVN